jgi:hypothetical protein
MADLTYLAKGLNIIGQTYLNKKATQQQYMNQVALEKLKQDSWLRNLQEQNERYKLTQQRMLDVEKERQGRMLEEQKAQYERDVRIKEIEDARAEKNWQLKDREVTAKEKEVKAKTQGTGYYKKGEGETTSKTSEDLVSKELNDLIKMRKIYEGTTKEGTTVGQDKSMLYEIDKRIRQLGASKYGFSPIDMEKGYYMKGLTGGGFTEENTKNLTEQRFSPKKQNFNPEVRFEELQAQGLTADDAFAQLKKEFPNAKWQ